MTKTNEQYSYYSILSYASKMQRVNAMWQCTNPIMDTTLLHYNKIPVVYVAHTLGCFINHA